MTAWHRIATPAYGAILLFAVGCAKQEQLMQLGATQETVPQQASQCVVGKGGLVVSIGGTKINFPESEKLNWIAVNDSNPVESRLVALGHAHVDMATAAKHVLRVYRYAAIDDYVLLCGRFEPLVPDGSFNWVVSKKDMKYIGHFLDKDSR